MRYANRTENRAAMKMAEVTLEAMYRGGLFDHVGGGFSRYSTDAQWLVPHFEKMLYDNALLVFAYTEAFQNSHRQLYETVVRRTVEYVLRELEASHGGFFCGQDADSEGVEGKYYVFTPNEVYDLLGKEDADAFCHRYGVTDRGNFEGKSIPNLIGQQDIETEPEGMDAIRERLRVFRLERTALHKDDIRSEFSESVLFKHCLFEESAVISDKKYRLDPVIEQEQLKDILYLAYRRPRQYGYLLLEKVSLLQKFFLYRPLIGEDIVSVYRI
jgi:uncharacterized protein YyaL (SSP411 family)